MLNLYRAATIAAGPLAGVALRRRASRGKEDMSRLGERFGRASASRPPGALVWIHAASVGEALSVLPLVERMLNALPKGHVLLTTGTLSSARLMKGRLPERAFHQFVPIDRPDAVCRFLDHWLPQLAIWVESELWPNLLRDTHRRQIPTVLVQGRMSAKSYRYWRWARRLIAPLLAGFDQVLVQTQADANRFRDLGAVQPMVTGTLKYAAPVLTAEETTLREMGKALGVRTRWLAASVHPGEFEIVYQTHLVLRSRFPDLLTIVVPRHPSSASDLEKEWISKGLSCARRGVGVELSPETEIYIADTMGELGLFYRISPVALIGGSFVDHGGQNPIEAIQLGCAVLTGPSMFNFSEVMVDFVANGVSVSITTPAELPEELSVLLAAPEHASVLAQQQKKAIAEKAGVIDNVFEALVCRLPAPE